MTLQRRRHAGHPRGFIREHFYDNDNGALIKLKEPDGAILQFANNADGLRYKKSDGLSYETQYSYQTDRSISASASNNFGRVSREINALNQTTDTDYGLYDQPTTTVDKRGNPITRNYYATTDAGADAVAGKLSELRATVNGTPNVLLASFTYYASGAAFGQLKQKVEYIDPTNLARKRVTDYVYEPNGVNLQSMSVWGANTPASENATYTYTYDGLGRLQTRSLMRRHSPADPTLIALTTTYAYDALDRVTRVTDPGGIVRETVYDANGQVYQEKVHYPSTQARDHCAVPANGYVVCTEATHTYDAADRHVSTTDILGNTTSFAYDANGNLVQQRDANGHTTRYEYDAMNRRSAVIDANGHRTEMTYDLGGRLIETKDANGHVTRYEYDALGRQTKVTTALGYETQTQYDANGNVTHITDANASAGGAVNNQGASVYRVYDELNRLTLERDALNGETRYTYDLLGNITRITDATGQVTTYVYNDLGRLTAVIDPVVESPSDQRDQILVYDQAGNVLAERDRSGRVRAHTYDVLNRLRMTQFTYDEPDTVEHYEYDAFGDLIRIANNEVSYTYSYTPRHALASKTDSRLGKTMHWTYDAVGNMISKTDYQGEVTEFQYDSTNRLVAEKNAAYLQVSYHYDGAGRLLNRILSNGAQTDYKYDNDNRLTGLKNRSADGTVVEDLAYTRDRVGNITSITDAASGKTTAYTYDARYRLTGVDSSTDSEDRAYTYDAVGNRRTETANGSTYYYCYHASDCSQGPSGNRLINIRTGSLTGPLYRQFTYDDAGRILQKQTGTGSPIYSVTYNGKGRASQISGTQTHTFAYDPNDYRIQKDSNLYHLEGENLEATYSSSGQLQNKYLRGVVVDEIVNGYTYHSSNPNDWTNYTFHHDQLNSVTALTGHAGSTEETTKFDAFGAPLSLTIPGTGNDLLYTGREYDRGTGLYYYRARYYDPEIGRFISEDPLGFEAGVNFYTYVNNNPINANDPEGKIVNFVVGALIGAGGELAAQFAESVITGQEFAPDLSRIGVAAAAGATGVGIGNLANRLGRIGSLAVNGTSEIVLGVGQEVVNAGSLDAIRNLTPEQALLLGATGVGSGAAGNFAADRFLSSPSVQIDLRQADRLSRIGQSRIDNGLLRPSRAQARFDQADQILSSVNQAASIRSTVTGGLVGATSSTAFRVGETLSQDTASGGFVLYPSKPNTNALQSVYSK